MRSPDPDDLVQADPWAMQRHLTPARIGLGRSGVSLPTREALAFAADHAAARDAVHLPLDATGLANRLAAEHRLPVLQVQSAARDRATFLLRPDLGRRLSSDSTALLEAQAGEPCDLLLVLADGLSAAAVERQAPPLLAELLRTAPPQWRLGPLVVATQARVALGDGIGECLGAKMVAVLIGERPGLSSPDSLGVYLTRAPRVGRTDAERNCLSNIRPAGLSFAEAARKLWWLAQAAARGGATGVALKDQSDAPPRLAGAPGPV